MAESHVLYLLNVKTISLVQIMSLFYLGTLYGIIRLMPTGNKILMQF